MSRATFAGARDTFALAAAHHYDRSRMDAALLAKLNLLLESERAGVVALDLLVAQASNLKLKAFLAAGRDHEAANVSRLETLLREAGATPSNQTGLFAAKIAALPSVHERLALLSRGQAWVALRVEEALELAPAQGPIRAFLTAMANRHRHEIEWERAEIIRLMTDPD